MGSYPIYPTMANHRGFSVLFYRGKAYRLSSIRETVTHKVAANRTDRHIPAPNPDSLTTPPVLHKHEPAPTPRWRIVLVWLALLVVFAVLYWLSREVAS